MGILMRNEINYSGNGSSSPSTATSLSNLTDVEITSLANGQGLFYDGELQKWVNGDIVSGGTSCDNTSTYEASIDYVDITLTTANTEVVGEYPNDFNIDNCVVVNIFILDSNGKPCEMFPKSAYDVASLSRPYQYVRMRDNGIAISTNVESLLNRTCRVFLMKNTSNNNASSSSTTGTLKPWLYDSDNEIVIGVYDGKPLYRKKVNIVLPSTAYEYTSILHNISDVEEIFINHNYSYLVMENGSRIPINAVRPSSSTNINGGMSIWSMAGAENISVVIGGTYVDCAAVFTLEYTKTTDAEGSGEGLMPYGVGGGSSLINYSTEEQVIGKWIDGRDLYQKTYDINGISINANTWYDYIIDNTGIDFVTKIEGYRVSSDKTQTYPMNQYKTSDASLQGCTFLYNADLPAIAIRPTSANTDTGVHWYVTIQYVKTTDTTT